MKIYFAGSISGGRQDAALYMQIISLLRKYGEVLTEHIGAESLTSLGEALDDKTIHDRDIAWLRSADMMVAEVTTPSLGVGYEIGKATEWKIPVLCLYRAATNRRLSGMLAGCGGAAVIEYLTLTELEPLLDEHLDTHKLLQAL
jgi:nucleoside 2-deoxyribosyltransferase